MVTSRDSTFYTQQIEIMEQKGVSHTILAPRKQSPNFSDRSDISRTYLDYAPLAFESLKKIVDPYDLVHANFGLTSPFALMHVNKPVVLTLWGSDLFGKYGWVSKKAAQYCDEVVVRNDEMEEYLDCEAHIIPGGVDLSLFCPMPRNKARDRVGWETDGKHVLFAADPDNEIKNYPLAKRVVSQAQNEISDEIRLQVVNDADHGEMPFYMNAADALIVTSKREGSPNIVKEALACNLPVVSRDVGDVRDRLSSVSGTAVCRRETELVNELARILQQHRRSDGRSAVRDVSLERMADRIFDVYQRAVEDDEYNSKQSIVLDQIE